MVRIRHGLLVAVLGLGLGASACKKDEKKADPATGGTPTGQTAEKPATGTPTTPVTPSAGAAQGGDLALLPVDSEVVIGLNFAQLQKSALWQKFVAPAMMKPEQQKKLEEFKAKCGFDPMASVQSISMGLKNLGGDTPDGVVVAHGLPKAKMMGCLDAYKAEAEKEGTTVTTDQDVILVKDKRGETVAMSFVDDDTLIGVMGANANPAGVKAAAAGTSTLKSSPTFVELYSKINTGDSLWVLANGNSKAFDPLSALGSKPKAIYGSVNVTDGLALDLRARMETADQAQQLATMANSQAQAVKPMVDNLEVKNDGSDVQIKVALSTQKLEALAKQFGSMMGGMGGM